VTKALAVLPEEQTDCYLFQNFTLSAKQRAFLTAYTQGGTTSTAADLSGVSRRIHWYWLEQPEYAAAFAKAQQMAGDLAEDEVYRRAFVGYEKPITYEGEITGHYTCYSDLLAMFHLKGLRPHKYRDNFEGLPSGSKIQINVVTFQPSMKQVVAPLATPIMNKLNGDSSSAGVELSTWTSKNNEG
jgi:hypothetical protein